MIIATSVKALLLTALAVVSLWRVGTAGDATAMFALRAHIIESDLVLTLTLPAVCVRLTTHLAQELTNLSALVWCDHCVIRASRRLPA